MMLFVGLGNPGPAHAQNRHNAGFMAIDAIAEAYGIGPFRKKFKGSFAEGKIGRAKLALLKPETYMNLSGESVRAAASFYKVPLAKIVVFYDEIDLASGKVKVKTGGGTAGHNGLESLVAHLGDGFRRVRIGIGHPGHKELVHRHVLSDFSKAEQEWLAPLLKAIAENAGWLVKGEDARFLNDVALALKG
ncbi:MAG TPA: aminoacyl-tRNA hydrolase [Sphingomonadales bacterium]|nr:aminoacyl-tRNA hydrolase [Sphingomonadales bacterium]